MSAASSTSRRSTRRSSRAGIRSGRRLWDSTAATVEVDLPSAGASRRELVLNTISDFTNQLSGAEWLDALPADTHEDRRLKEIFRVNCTECHQPGLVLQNRFDEQGWLAMIEVMERATYHGWPGMGAPPRNTITFHKQELAKYLARIRGPEPFR